MRAARAMALTALLLLIPAGSASAAVLVESVPTHLVCGDAIHVGIWAQSWTTGSRSVRISAYDARSGRLWWRRTATASKRTWRDWYLPSGMGGQCSPTVIVYRGAGWKARYRVSFSSEGV